VLDSSFTLCICLYFLLYCRRIINIDTRLFLVHWRLCLMAREITKILTKIESTLRTFYLSKFQITFAAVARWKYEKRIRSSVKFKREWYIIRWAFMKLHHSDSLPDKKIFSHCVKNPLTFAFTKALIVHANFSEATVNNNRDEFLSEGTSSSETQRGRKEDFDEERGCA